MGAGRTWCSQVRLVNQMQHGLRVHNANRMFASHILWEEEDKVKMC